ncbi:MAG TPA: undecaprenyl-phosphate galactose phosphotransferase WbaP [Bryobacteraceae bacterium]|jgi:Undecaprenyl-phosphate galactose phosphotransferase WbaP|nr:undecaprenyl-phosphate galactose phosphotransferase WbaP [Bryobacteraceae bacterium]
MITTLVIGDALSLALAGAIAILVKLVPSGQMGSLHSYLALIPLLPVFLLVYCAIGLYSGISLGSPEELRRLTLSSILVSLLLGVLTFPARGTGTVFTGTMAIALFWSVILVPLTRVCLRMKFAGSSWWGYPTVVFGDKANAEALIRNLVIEPGLGLKPIGLFAPDAWRSVHGVPALAERELDRMAHSIHGPAYAVLVSSGATREQMDTLIRAYRRYFSHILVIPNFSGFSCLWVNPRNLGGMLGLEVCQQVFLPSRQLVKRIIDLVLTIAIGVVLAPVLLLVALAIRLDSPGPIIYGQRRIGRGGRDFKAWKFRSMVANADEILRVYLDENPELRAEWDATHKLKDDPRVTKLGRFLRRTSLDEFPQLWNVLTGEMSLVGPRPIVRDEIRHYGMDFETYTYVQSGLTGLWQVSGRSETSYEQRVDFDRFYVQNWSVWLDLCILFRTIGTVLSRAGAF